MLRRGFKAIRDIIGDPTVSPTRAQLEAICDVIFQERDEAHRTELLRDAVTPQGLVVAALIGSMCDPSTYWPDIDLARVRVETTAAFC